MRPNLRLRLWNVEYVLGPVAEVVNRHGGAMVDADRAYPPDIREQVKEARGIYCPLHHQVHLFFRVPDLAALAWVLNDLVAECFLVPPDYRWRAGETAIQYIDGVRLDPHAGPHLRRRDRDDRKPWQEGPDAWKEGGG